MQNMRICVLIKPTNPQLSSIHSKKMLSSATTWRCWHLPTPLTHSTVHMNLQSYACILMHTPSHVNKTYSNKHRHIHICICIQQTFTHTPVQGVINTCIHVLSLSFITSLVPKKIVLHSLSNPGLWTMSTNAAYMYIWLSKKEYTEACQLKKLRGIDSLAFPDMVHSKDWSFRLK